MKRIQLFLLLILLTFAGCSVAPSNKVSYNESNNTKKAASDINSNESSDERSDDESGENSSDNSDAKSDTGSTENSNENFNTGSSNSPDKEETVVSEFTTEIKSKSKNRANNINLTCNKINEVTVQPNEEFSFCNTIGVSKESEGYKKADVIVNKKVVQALGGGNCQVSTTLYNAVLAVKELEVTERHPHGKKVNYVPEGKDAAIAHGSKDLKFKNNSDKTLKIYADSDGKNVHVKLVEI